MFYDPERAYSSLPFKKIGYIALLIVVFIAGVVVGSAETEEVPESQQVVVGPTATSIPVPTAKKFPTSAPTPTLIPVDIHSPEFKIYGAKIGDCRLLISTSIFVSLSKEEYEEALRRERCSEERIEELLATFADGQAEARAHLGMGPPVIPTPTLDALPTASPEQDRWETEFWVFSDLREAALYYPRKWQELDADGMPRTNEESQYQCSTLDEAHRRTLAFRDELVRRIDADLPVPDTYMNQVAYDVTQLRVWLEEVDENLELHETMKNACRDVGW